MFHATDGSQKQQEAYPFDLYSFSNLMYLSLFIQTLGLLFVQNQQSMEVTKEFQVGYFLWLLLFWKCDSGLDEMSVSKFVKVAKLKDQYRWDKSVLYH